MTDKEFKRLSRSQLIEIIYQFQIKVEELTKENQTLNTALEDKRLRITRAGNIAEAAMEVNNVMQAAQNAAQQYLNEIQALYSEIDTECQKLRNKAAAEADLVTRQAKADAEAMLAQAREQGSAVISRAREEANALLSRAQTEADTLLSQARTEADAIAAGANQRWDTDEELEKILFEYGTSSGK